MLKERERETSQLGEITVHEKSKLGLFKRIQRLREEKMLKQVFPKTFLKDRDTAFFSRYGHIEQK